MLVPIRCRFVNTYWRTRLAASPAMPAGGDYTSRPDTRRPPPRARAQHRRALPTPQTPPDKMQPWLRQSTGRRPASTPDACTEVTEPSARSPPLTPLPSSPHSLNGNRSQRMVVVPSPFDHQPPLQPGGMRVARIGSASGEVQLPPQQRESGLGNPAAPLEHGQLRLEGGALQRSDLELKPELVEAALQRVKSTHLSSKPPTVAAASRILTARGLEICPKLAIVAGRTAARRRRSGQRTSTATNPSVTHSAPEGMPGAAQCSMESSRSAIWTVSPPACGVTPPAA